MEKIVLFGNSIFAENMHYLLTHDSPYEVAAFTVDAKYIREERLLGLPVVPFENVEASFPPGDYKMSVAVSFQKINKLRQEKYAEARAKGYSLINYISSRAARYPGLAIGDNCIVLENAVIEPYAVIGSNVIIAAGAIIAHHALIRDHSFISPGAVILGGVTVDEYCLIGANATVKEEVKVARECVIGSGVVITKNTREKEVYTVPGAVLYPMRSDVLSQWLTWPVRSKKIEAQYRPE